MKTALTSEARFHQEAAFRYDSTGLHGKQAEFHYQTALELDPTDAVTWGRYLVYLSGRARNIEAEEMFYTAIQLLPRSDDLYLKLHIPYCNDLLQFARTDQAKNVLDDITLEFQQTNKHVHSLRNLLAFFNAVQADCDVFPLSVHSDDWNKGPHLTSKEKMTKWFAGKVTWSTKEYIQVLVGKPPFYPDGVFGVSKVDRPFFEKCCIVDELPDLDPDSDDNFSAHYIEGVYREGKEDPEIYFHQPKSFELNLPEPELDRLRYVKNWT